MPNLRIPLLTLTISAILHAQDPDRTWKNLITEGQHLINTRNFAEAEQSFRKSLHEAERFGKDDPRVALSLENLGQTLMSEKKSADADTALRKSLEIFQNLDGIESVETANVELDLARLALADGHPAEAILLARKTLPVYEKELGAANLQTASVVCLIGDSLRIMKNFTDAEEPLRRCANTRESSGGIQSLEFAEALHSLSLVYIAQKKYLQAESRITLAEKIRENKLGLTNPLVAETLDDHAMLLRLMGREKEAARLAALSTAIRRSDRKQ